MKFKDLWIKPEADEKSSASEEGVSAASPTESRPRVVAAEGDTSPFIKQLEMALEKANLPSQQDYLDFAKALKNMESLPMDEATRYKAAYATLQSVGCDLRELIESFTYYQGILDGEKDKFEEALRATVSETVNEKERQIKQLAAENEDHSAEIQKLTAAININQQKLNALQAELGDVNTKLGQRKAGFLAAYSALRQRMQGDEGKIKMYLSAELSNSKKP
jgi:chromosome segregation ATPase